MDKAVTTIVISRTGKVQCLWNDKLKLHTLGRIARMNRVSTIEFNSNTQRWEVRLASRPSRVAFSHPRRDTCLWWEKQHINDTIMERNKA